MVAAMTRRTALWVLAALLGLAVAAAISWGTSTLTSQHIGLASEPVSAGRSLAPDEAAHGRTQTTKTRTTPRTTPRGKTVTTTVTTSPPSSSPEVGASSAGTAAPPAQGGADDSSGAGSGRDD